MMSAEVEMAPSAADAKDGNEKKAKGPKEPPPPIASLKEFYQFTSAFEKTLLYLGALLATGAGVCMPMTLIAFSGAFEQMGVAATVPGMSVLSSKTLEMLYTFIYIGSANLITRFGYYYCVESVCQSQIFRYRQARLSLRIRHSCRSKNELAVSRLCRGRSI